MNKPLVSVIIPVYNGERYIRDAVNSVLAQPCGDTEIVIVDDGSKDSTRAVCQELQSRDGRIKLICKENTGVSDSRNRALDAAAGKYVCFLDSDDMWVENFFDGALAEQMQQTDSDMYAFNIYYTDIDLNVIKQTDFTQETFVNRKDEAVDHFWHTFCAYFYRKKLLDENNLRFDTSLKYYEDELFRSAALYLSDKITGTGKYLLYYRANQYSSTCLHRDIKLFATQKLQAFELFKEFFTKQYQKEGRDAGFKNAKTVQYFIRALKDLSEIGYGYRKIKMLCQNEPAFKLLKSGAHTLRLDTESKEILDGFLKSPRTYYIKHRAYGLVHNTLADTKHKVQKKMGK